MTATPTIITATDFARLDTLEVLLEGDRFPTALKEAITCDLEVEHEDNCDGFSYKDPDEDSPNVDLVISAAEANGLSITRDLALRYVEKCLKAEAESQHGDWYEEGLLASYERKSLDYY